jgi:hypothetical protein
MKEQPSHKRFINTGLAKYRQAADVPFHRPAPRNAQRATRDAQPATRNFLSFSVTIIFLLLFVIPATNAAITENEAFKETVHRLSSLGDRSTGTDGNRAAAAYIKERFEQIGFHAG